MERVILKIIYKNKNLFIQFTPPLLKRMITFSIIIANKITSKVLGITARTENGLYVIFTDYDDKFSLTQRQIEEELKYLQKKHNLSEWYIFKMPDLDNSFHAICLDVMPLFKVIEILRETSCDPAFINAWKYYQGRSWILRIGKKGGREKPVFCKILK